MVRISKVYTRTGDKGETDLADGSRISKDACRIDAIGDLDELNCQIGKVCALLVENNCEAQLLQDLTTIQNEIFDIGAAMATPADFDKYPVFEAGDHEIKRLENFIDKFNEKLPVLNSFILPGNQGGTICAELHLARAICRRAERSALKLAKETPIKEGNLVYLNRLSDLLFVAARATTKTPQLWVKYADR